MVQSYTGWLQGGVGLHVGSTHVKKKRLDGGLPQVLPTTLSSSRPYDACVIFWQIQLLFWDSLRSRFCSPSKSELHQLCKPGERRTVHDPQKIARKISSTVLADDLFRLFHCKSFDKRNAATPWGGFHLEIRNFHMLRWWCLCMALSPMMSQSTLSNRAM